MKLSSFSAYWVCQVNGGTGFCLLASTCGEAAVEGDVEGVQGGLPPVGPPLAALPGRVQAHQCQVEALQGGLFGREVAAGVHGPPEPRIYGLDRIRCADYRPYLVVELQERGEFRPRVLPEPYDGRVALLPFPGELRERVDRGRLRRRGVNRLEVFGDRRPVLLRRVLERISQEMNNTCLHDCLFPDGVTRRVGEAFQAVADDHEDVLRAAVLDLGKDAEPELGALAVAVLAGPQAQDVPGPVGRDAQGEVNRPVRDLSLPDLDLDRVDEHDRVNRAQR